MEKMPCRPDSTCGFHNETNQVVTFTPGEILYWVITWMCSTQKHSTIQQHFTFNKTAQKVPTEAITWETSDVIGK